MFWSDDQSLNYLSRYYYLLPITIHNSHREHIRSQQHSQSPLSLVDCKVAPIIWGQDVDDFLPISYYYTFWKTIPQVTILPIYFFKSYNKKLNLKGDFRIATLVPGRASKWILNLEWVIFHYFIPKAL